MMEKRKNSGFTLAELLIVVAVIMLLVAVAIPRLFGHLERAREVSDVANIRAAYSEASTEYLCNPAGGDTQTVEGVKLNSKGALEYVDAGDLPFVLPQTFAFEKGTYSVTFDFSAEKPTVALSRQQA